MYTVTKFIDFCYGHRLLEYKGKCCNIHGHNGKAEVELYSEKLNDLGMVVDFVDIKNILMEWIDENLDHQLLLSKDDPLVDVLKSNGVGVFVMDSNPTAESIARLIYDLAVSKGLPVNRVTFWETDSSFAVYDGKK